MRQKRLADAESPAGGHYEEILEVEAGPREPRRVVVEKESETHGLAAHFREDHLGEAFLSEEMLLEELRVGVAILGLPLVFGEGADQGNDRVRVRRPRPAKGERGLAHSAFDLTLEIGRASWRERVEIA